MTEIKLKELKRVFAEKYPEGSYWKDKSHYVMAYQEDGKCYHFWSCTTLRDFFCSILKLNQNEVNNVWNGWRN